MSRDQRVHNNWALLFARRKAEILRQPLIVIFSLAPSFLGAPLRHYDFILKSLQEVESTLRRLNIPFYLLQGEPEKTLPRFIQTCKAGVLVTDYSPLKISRKWKTTIGRQITIPLYEIDAHNIVPCWIASEKQEFSARTFRPKITSLLNEFLTKFPDLDPLSTLPDNKPVEWHNVFHRLNPDPSVPSVTWLKPGEQAAEKCLDTFLHNKLATYSEKRNNPNAESISNLSPFIHFGQISAQYIALKIAETSASEPDKKAFLEELIVRRELSENYCNYNDQYDSFEGIPAWAKATLTLHTSDNREYLYSANEFANAQTHEKLWNAAQIELVSTGKIHGYMRMYWAKKILEWSKTPQQAFETAIILNDRYALDGRDPNGYTGVAWAVGGLHDRPWFERTVYGKIRYMNASGCARKFDINSYIQRFNPQKLSLF
jgi:deoxyribodipyrimidine photo-lyase